MNKLTTLAGAAPPAPILNEEIEELSRLVSAHLAKNGGDDRETRDLVFRLSRVEDAIAGLRAGRGQIMRRMITFVCFAIGVRPNELISERRCRQLAHGRFAIMWAAKLLTSYSFPRIAKELGGFDHTSVMHGVKRAEELRATNPDFRYLTDKLFAHFSSEDREEAPPCRLL